ncbi:MAG: NIPSNAP family protein [Flavisolibacter sp.]
MKRRSFVKASLLTTAFGGMIPMVGKSSKNSEDKKTSSEFYELRAYTLNNQQQEQLLDTYFEKAAIPALNRIGCKPVGVFKEMKPEGQTKFYVLIPYPTLEYITIAEQKLSADKEYQKDAYTYLNAPATSPAYERIESSLLRSFKHMPRIESPSKKSRMFELRRYESSSEAAGKKKIEMFNDAGEIDIFRRTGLTPVFFGETIIGGLRPNLTYMLTFSDMADHDKSWKAFGSDPEWKKISGMPEYADAKIVSHITSTFLIPTDYSQI